MLSVNLCLNEKGKLRIKDLFCQLRHELFEETASIVAHLIHSVLINEHDFEFASCIKVLITPVNGKRILKDELSSHSEGNGLAQDLKTCFVLIQRISEHFGPDFEVISPGQVLEHDWIEH